MASNVHFFAVQYSSLLFKNLPVFGDIYCSAKMSNAKVNKRKYKEDYIKYGFTCLQKDGEDIPQCVVHENAG